MQNLFQHASFIEWCMEISAYAYSDMSLVFVPIFQMTQITDDNDEKNY